MSDNQIIIAGSKSTNIQAEGNVNITNNFYLSVEELLKMAKSGEELHIQAKESINYNLNIFKTEILKKNGQIEITDSNKIFEIFSAPDFQVFFKKASIIASKTSNLEDHKNLSSLIIYRINNDNSDLKKIISSGAINNLEKITINQLKILVLCLFIKHIKMLHLKTIDEFFDYFEDKVKSFLDFDCAPINFEHLSSTDCMTWAQSHFDIEILGLFKTSYPFVFKEIKDCEEILTSNVITAKLLKILKETPIKRIHLTPVGKLLACTYYEQVKNEKINIE